MLGGKAAAHSRYEMFLDLFRRVTGPYVRPSSCTGDVCVREHARKRQVISVRIAIKYRQGFC
jgi:hypothetical protein